MPGAPLKQVCSRKPERLRAGRAVTYCPSGPRPGLPGAAVCACPRDYRSSRAQPDPGVPSTPGSGRAANVFPLLRGQVRNGGRNGGPRAGAGVLQHKPDQDAQPLLSHIGPLPDPDSKNRHWTSFQAGRLDLVRSQDHLWVHTAALTQPVNILEASAASAGWIIRDEPIWHGQSLRRTKDARSCR